MKRAGVLGQHDDKPEEMRHHPTDLAQPINHRHIGAQLQEQLSSEQGDSEDEVVDPSNSSERREETIDDDGYEKKDEGYDDGKE